jgi:Protein of unknown function (DUF1572)
MASDGIGNGGVEANFLAYAARRMKMSQGDIRRCVERLSEEQMGCRGGAHENSVVNLLLHLSGNIRQWVLHGIGGQPDVRERDEEFTLAKTVDAAEAHRRFDGTVDEAVGVIAGARTGKTVRGDRSAADGRAPESDNSGGDLQGGGAPGNAYRADYFVDEANGRDGFGFELAAEAVGHRQRRSGFLPE